ncbi:universal stress protein [Actinorhabdospora filicis]|nr:universal stress protein [Actinorhabdospora filicis]
MSGEITEKIGKSDTIVVGVDGSDASSSAIVWAAREAALRGLPLRLVHAVVWSMIDTPMDLAAYGIPREDLRAGGEAILAEAADAARAAAPGVSVSTHMEVAGPAGALLTASEDAELLVVGNRGHGGFTGLLVGSTAVQVTAHATCPVAVVRPDRPDTGSGPIVVGVDGSPEAGNALTFAVREARLRDCPVEAVYGLDDDQPADELASAERLLDKALLEQDAAGVSLTARVVRRRPTEALIEATRTASLVAVGGRGHGGFRGLLFGSVSHALIHHAECPVVIARDGV